MKGKAGYGARRREGHRLILALGIILLLMIGLTMAIQPIITVTRPQPRISVPGIKPAEELVIERDWGPLAPVVKAFSNLGKALSGEVESVGLEAEIGYTSTSGESFIFTQKFSGVQAGFIGMSGIYVKPKLGDYRALKLYDHQRGLEGEVWVRPILRVKTYQGIPEEYSFNVKVKVSVDGEVIHEKALERAGKGVPPEKIEFEKLSVPGKVFHLMALGEKELARKILAGERPTGGFQIPNQPPKTREREICFYADYQGMVRFEGDDEPVVKELKDALLGCFSFQFKETGDFEMIVERNITVAPLAEVMVASESGMAGMTPVIETRTITVKVPYTTRVTETKTVYQPGQTITYTTTYTVTEPGTTYTVTETVVEPGTTYTITQTITSTITQPTTQTITQTITEYTTQTLTKTETKWKTTVITSVITKEVVVREEYPVYIPVTRTVTVTKYVEKYGGGGYGGGYYGGRYLLMSPVILYYPYSEFIFIND